MYKGAPRADNTLHMPGALPRVGNCHTKECKDVHVGNVGILGNSGRSAGTACTFLCLHGNHVSDAEECGGDGVSQRAGETNDKARSVTGLLWPDAMVT